MHDRMRAVDELELVVVPGRPLGALVLAVADLDRRLLAAPAPRVAASKTSWIISQSPSCSVVPVVEDVEEPVLERELAGMRGIGRDVRVDGRRVPCGEPALPAQVVAARIERVPREVEVVLVEAAARDRFAVGPILTRSPRPTGPRSATVGSPKSSVDVDRLVRLAGAAARLCRRRAARPARSARRAPSPRRGRRPRAGAAASATTGRASARRRAACGHAAPRSPGGPRREQVEPQPPRQEARGELALDAVAGVVERRRERAEPALARRDGDDARRRCRSCRAARSSYSQSPEVSYSPAVVITASV